MQQPTLIKSSPHISDRDTVPRIMWSVVLALLPAAGMSVYFFGWQAVTLIVAGMLSAEVAEVACLRMRKKPLRDALDGSAAVTGLLLAMVLPPSAPPYCAVVGSLVAVCIAKHCFGGLGHNIWNPALIGRIFVQFAYPAAISLSAWPAPRMLFGSGQAVADALTQASPLLKEGAAYPGYLDLLLGNGVAGSLGETCKAALLIGGIYLIITRRVDWRVPLFYVGTVFVLTAWLPARSDAPAWSTDPLYHVLSGGLIIGAFFMATDMVTSPVTRMGRIIFATGCGVIVSLVRLYGGYPEGVAYSIVLMNTITPLIDRWCRPRIYGSRTPKPAPRAT